MSLKIVLKYFPLLHMPRNVSHINTDLQAVVQAINGNSGILIAPSSSTFLWPVCILTDSLVIHKTNNKADFYLVRERHTHSTAALRSPM